MGPDLAEDAIEQCGLATTVGADDTEDLALADGEGNAVDRLDGAEAPAHIPDLEQRAHGLPPSASPAPRALMRA